MKTRFLSSLLMIGLFLLVCGVANSFAASASAASATPDNAAAGSVTGRVRFEGQVPQPTHVNMAADPSCTKGRPASAMNEEFVTGNGGTLGNVVVFISDGLGGRTFDVPADPVVVEQKGCMYEPHVTALRANQKLKVVNNDLTIHNIHPVPANNREWNKAEPAGSTLEETFAREEIAIPVKCNVHPWMRSYIAVFKHPFFTVTSKDGHFDLHNLPPGEYTVEAWHEKLGTMKQKITIAPGEAKNTDFVFKAPGH